MLKHFSTTPEKKPDYNTLLSFLVSKKEKDNVKEERKPNIGIGINDSQLLFIEDQADDWDLAIDNHFSQLANNESTNAPLQRTESQVAKEMEKFYTVADGEIDSSSDEEEKHKDEEEDGNSNEEKGNIIKKEIIIIDEEEQQSIKNDIKKTNTVVIKTELNIPKSSSIDIDITNKENIDFDVERVSGAIIEQQKQIEEEIKTHKHNTVNSTNNSSLENSNNSKNYKVSQTPPPTLSKSAKANDSNRRKSFPTSAKKHKREEQDKTSDGMKQTCIFSFFTRSSSSGLQ